LALAPCFVANLVGLLHNLLFAGHVLVHYNSSIFAAAEVKATAFRT
jgi:hypothetical protein